MINKIWEKRNRQLINDMNSFLSELVKKGCRKCDNADNDGYIVFPETGKVCKHMIDERYKKFKKRIQAELDEMKEEDLDSFLGLKSNIKDSKWKHPNASGSELIKMFRRKSNSRM